MESFNLKRHIGAGLVTKTAGSPVSDFTNIDIAEMLNYLDYTFSRRRGSHATYTHPTGKTITFACTSENPGYSFYAALKENGFTKEQIQYYVTNRKSLIKEKKTFQREHPSEPFTPRMQPAIEKEVVQSPVVKTKTEPQIDWNHPSYREMWETIKEEINHWMKDSSFDQSMLAWFAEQYGVPENEIKRRVMINASTNIGWYKKAISLTPDTPEKPFTLGQIVCTPAAEAYCLENNVPMSTLIKRHSSCDWGDISEDDKATNNESLKHQGMLMSSYNIGPAKVWVITDPGWSVTTILLPEDY